MCRLVAYLGNPVCIQDVLYKPENSLIAQSHAARESLQTINGDGFGLGWYNPEIDKSPGVFRSVSPAWSNQNLLHITSKIKSGCFFAHIRAASHGIVSDLNCHPFHYKKFLFMHNGGIDDFYSIKRKLRAKLSDETYEWVKGQTDSEHIFALFIDFLSRELGNNIIMRYKNALENTIHEIIKLQKDYCPNKKDISYLNLVVCDGERIVASRYVSDTKKEARSLHYTLGSECLYKNNRFVINPKKSNTHAMAIVASEVLTEPAEHWHKVQKNHIITIDKDFSVSTYALS